MAEVASSGISLALIRNSLVLVRSWSAWPCEAGKTSVSVTKSLVTVHTYLGLVGVALVVFSPNSVMLKKTDWL